MKNHRSNGSRHCFALSIGAALTLLLRANTAIPADAPCRVSNMIDCSMYERAGDYIALPSGEKVPNLLRSGKPMQKMDLNQNQRVAVKSVFEETKKLLLAELRQGRADELLPPSLKSMVKRVEAVEFGKILDSCESFRPNASLNPFTGRVNICAAYAAGTRAALVRVLAHEISHSIDFCNLQGSLYQRTRLNSDRNRAPTYNGEPASENVRLFFENSGVTLNLNPAVRRFGTSAGEMSALESRGLVQLITDAVPFGQHPLHAVLRCLDREKEAGVGGAPGTKLTPLHQRDTHPAGSSIQHDPIGASGGCYIGETTWGEDSADVIAARIVGRYLKTHPLRSSTERSALLNVEASAVCKGQTRDHHHKAKANVAHFDGRHSGDLFRAESIFFSDPLVQTAFRCKPKNPTQQQCLAGTEAALAGFRNLLLRQSSPKRSQR